MKVVVGTNCMPCKMLKEWLKDHNSNIEQVVAEDNMDMIEQLGVKSLPTLVLDDNTLIKGFENIVEYFEGE